MSVLKILRTNFRSLSSLRPTHSELDMPGINDQVVCECECAWFSHGRLQLTSHGAPLFRGFTRPSRDPPSSQGISARGGGHGWRQQGRCVKKKLQKTACFIVVKSLDVPPEHTTDVHPIRCLDTPERFAWQALPKFKVGPVLPDFRCEADWLKCPAPQT